MALDLPISLLYMFMAISISIFLVGMVMFFRKVEGAPVVALLSAIIMFALLVLVKNIEVDYVEAIDYTLAYRMNITTGATSSALNSAGLFATAERPANTASLLYNKVISCIRLDMARQGSPPAQTATIGILGDDNQIIKSFGTIEVSTMLTTQKTYNFCLANHDYWIISLYDRIGVFYNGGSAGNGLLSYSDTTNPFDTTNTVRATLSSAGSWTDSPTTDMRMTLLFDDANISGEPVLYPFNQHDIYPFTIFLSVIFVFLAVIFQLKDWS